MLKITISGKNIDSRKVNRFRNMFLALIQTIAEEYQEKKRKYYRENIFISVLLSI